MGSELTSNNPVVKAVVEGTAPRPGLVAASKGASRFPQNDLLEMLVALTAGTELRTNAQETLRSQSADAPAITLGSTEAAPVLAHFAAESGLSPRSASVLTNVITPAAIAAFARTTTIGQLVELISFNQQLLIQNPAIIDAIIANPNRTAEAERRATETKREFFEKERGAQQIANELRAKGNEAAAGVPLDTGA